MTRPLAVVDSRDVPAVLEGLRAALSGDGPAIMPHPGTPHGLPPVVERRVAVVVETSGSTGRPKRVALSGDALLASAAASDSQLGGPGQWLLALPAHYIAGINVLVRSLAAQTEPAIMDPEGFTPERFALAAADLGAERWFTSLVPVQLARLIEDDTVLELLRRFDRILVGGQAVPVPLAARALELGLSVTRTYGSSETSGGCVWDGAPIGDTEVRIVDGRVELAGSVLAEGYLDDPGRTALAFPQRDGRRWYRTDDTGELVDGALRVTGRADDVIVSGGVKVSLAEVELAVRGIPGLAEAVVVAVPHPQWGEVPVVVATNSPPLETVRDAVAAALGPAAAPNRVLLLDTIPTLASGKPDRLTIAALALG
ncbi:AMP-binding protein [Leifsonia sp. H3M29-4]|uniref:AMP-binding protein n=1 Tax=Salinibacterium metalliresistens TaxID=3031321 RepID=UPI0023D9910C|nr:AMP-binding protein [Salinibacterium metalliresistens]MDF1477957.1 AMP-binding protein [Salinibacterium metalliresistens]